jgi:hypothetical protein
LCFEPRHAAKRALFVREMEVCPYWHGKQLAQDKPRSLSDRIFAALYFSRGGAPRCCIEIKEWIDLEYGSANLVCDIARLLEHAHAHGRIVQAAPRASINERRTWVGRYQRILNSDEKGTVRFNLSASTVETFAERFASYVAEFGKRGAA